MSSTATSSGLSGKPTSIARQARNATQAQRYRRQWTEEIEDPDGDGDVQELTAAIDILERRFGDKLPANPLAAGLRKQIGDKRRSQRKSPGAGKRPQTGSQGRSQPRSGAKRRSRGSGSRWLPSSSGALEATGLPGASRGAAGFVLQLVGLTVGLALLYLFLADAERAGRGRSAIEGVWGFIAGGVNRIIAPIDPIPGGGGGSAAPAMDVAGGELPTTTTRPIAPSRQAYHAGRRRARARHQVRNRQPGRRR